MEKKELISPTELEIRLSFHNYKLLKKEEFTLKGSHIYFVKGCNEVGKSSILNALRAAHEIKDDTPQKVTKGEVEGVNEFTIPGPDNKMYNIVYEFTDSTTKFVVFDEDGNKISKITDMRNIFRYNHVDASEFISWSNTKEGRRKQKELILQLLPPQAYVEYTQLDNAEEEDYNKRTAVNKYIDSANKLIEEYTLTEAELTCAGNLQRAIVQLEKKEKELDSINNSNNELNTVLFKLQALENDYNNYINGIREIDNEIIELENKRKEYIEASGTIKTQLELNKVNYTLLEKEMNEKDIKKDQLIQTVKNGRDYVSNARIADDKLTKFKSYKVKLQEHLSVAESLTESIQSYRISKEGIITQSKFPVDNLMFDDEGYLTINGLRFDEKQTCESDTILLVAQLMCKMNDTPIQIIGDASLLDYNKLDRLYDIAEANGKIMFVDEIDRSLDKLVIVGYEKKHKSYAETVKEKRPYKKKEDPIVTNEIDDKPIF